ncbi:RING finger protein 208 [Anolis carolinensis]|uniref:RING finger protein 208 n=1 Tax=Anolis carolinensis TaxID=28377 RepID=UPI002F2B83E4
MQEGVLGEPGRPPESHVKSLLMSCLKGQQVMLKMEAMKIIHPEKFPPERQGVAVGPPSSRCFAPAPRREPPLAAKRAWPSEPEIIVNQACGGDLPALDPPGPLGLPRTPPLPRRGERLCFHRPPPPLPLPPAPSSCSAPSGEVIANQYALQPPPPLPPPPPASPCEPLECPTCGHRYNFTHKRPRILSCLHSVCEECLQILYESCPKYKFISCPTCKRETVLFTDYGLAALAVNTSILNRLPAEALAGPGNPVQWSSEADRSCYQTFRQYCGAACTCHVRNPLSSCTIM